MDDMSLREELIAIRRWLEETYGVGTYGAKMLGETIRRHWDEICSFEEEKECCGGAGEEKNCCCRKNA